MKTNDLQTLTLKSLVGRAQADRDLALNELAAARLAADDFADEAHRALFAAIEGRLREGRQLEAVSLASTVGARCPRQLVVDVVAGAEFLGLEPRARLLRELGQRRRAIRGFDAIRKMLAEGTQPLASAAIEAQRVLAAVSPDDSDVRAVSGDLMAFLDTLERIQRGEAEPVVPTGIEALDTVLGGGLPATLTVVAALPGVGKSALLGAIAGNLSRAGTRVGIMSLEDQRGWVLRRLAAQESALPLFVLGKRRLGQNQMERAGAAVETLHRHADNLVMSDAPGNIASVVARARQMVAEGCRAVLVDHLGEVRLERSDRHDLDIANALSELRGVAKMHGVPVVVACHLKRRDGLGVFTEPTLTDFAFSAAVERMARVALGLFLEEGHRELLNVTVLKQTEGPANFGLQLNVNPSCGLVVDTPATAELKRKMQWDN